MLVLVLSMVAYMVVSFAVQGTSHLWLNKAHYAAAGFTREDPIIPLGLAAMAIQGLLMSAVLTAWKGDAATVADGLAVAGAFAVMLLSYNSLAESSKYRVPSIGKWIGVELGTGAIQFTLFGLALGAIHATF